MRSQNKLRQQRMYYVVTLRPTREIFIAVHREIRYANIEKQLFAFAYGLDKNHKPTNIVYPAHFDGIQY